MTLENLEFNPLISSSISGVTKTVCVTSKGTITTGIPEAKTILAASGSR